MAKLNIQQINSKLANSNSLKALATNNANTKLQYHKNVLIDGFLEDSITKEIDEGNSGRSSSNFTSLKGGNLFTFIGFNEGDVPSVKVVDMLESKIQFKNRAPKISFQKGTINYRWEINAPSEQDLIAAAPLPFDSAKSWLRGIEDGIFGLTAYIYWKIGVGRSGGGLEAKDGSGNLKQLRSDEFTGKGKDSYIGKYLNKFLAAIGRTKYSG